MYTFLTLLTGVTLAVMVTANGNLSAQYGAFSAAVIIHAVGSAAALLLCCFQKEKRRVTGHRPLWIYLGGVIGVATTVLQNAAFGHISVTSIVALGLLGQTATSLLIDGLGLFGMRRVPFRAAELPGLLFALAGIYIMFDSSLTFAAMLSIAASFAAGIAVVLSRIVNAKLAEKTGALRSSMAAHVTGLPVTIIIALLATKGRVFSGAAPAPFRPWIYMGGVMGVVVILLCNLTVPKVSSFGLTILTFTGQVFMSIALDLLAGSRFSNVSFTGGVVIALGMALNYLLEYIAKSRRKLPDA